MSNSNKIIISCESCGARFYVNSVEIHNNGRFVRCGICEHEWLVTVQQSVPVFYDIENKNNQCIVLLKKNKKYLYGLAVLFSSFVMLIFLYYFDKFEIPNDIRTIKKNWSQDIVIKDISYKFLDVYEALQSLDHYRKFLLIILSVENLANVSKTLEDVQIIALNKNKIQMMQVSVTPYQVIHSFATFKMTIKLPLDRIVPSYINVIINKKRTKSRDLSSKSDKLIKISKSQN